jgi:hypothetical protein
MGKEGSWGLDQKDPVEFVALKLAAKNVDRFEAPEWWSETTESNASFVTGCGGFDGVIGESPPSAAVWNAAFRGTAWDRSLARHLVQTLEYIEYGKADPAEDEKGRQKSSTHCRPTYCAFLGFVKVLGTL